MDSFLIEHFLSIEKYAWIKDERPRPKEIELLSTFYIIPPPSFDYTFCIVDIHRYSHIERRGRRYFTADWNIVKSIDLIFVSPACILIPIFYESFADQVKSFSQKGVERLLVCLDAKTFLLCSGNEEFLMFDNESFRVMPAAD